MHVKGVLSMTYAEMSTEELWMQRRILEGKYDEYRAQGLDLNMARGKPGSDQLELSRPMLDIISSGSELAAEDGTDCRNYGVLTGIPEAKRFMAEMLGTSPENVIVCGNASLNIEYDVMSHAMVHGVLGGEPWLLQAQKEPLKFLCPAPGYDRHFAICEAFGLEMVTVDMTPTGPDMDAVEELVKDPQVKGIWCVPVYSNPTGVTYSDETVGRLAAMETAAEDFRIFWDNAYCVHHLYDDPTQQERVRDILEACLRAGHPDRVYEFCSTSKITFPGAGIAAIAASEANIASLTQLMSVQTIGHDKLNQLRHVRFLQDRAGLTLHMRKHAELLRPKFEAVLRILEEDLGGLGIATWETPRGGYFISFNGPEGSAKRIVKKAAKAGVKLTGAGATYPYGKDPHDSNIRIAPSFPSLEELEQAARIFTICVRLVALKQLLKD